MITATEQRETALADVIGRKTFHIGEQKHAGGRVFLG
jgi:hypothetical protein